MKTFLVTGGAGFIGSNFIPFLLKRYVDYKVVTLDLLTYAGNIDNLSDVSDSCRHTFVQGDICDRDLVEQLFDQYDFDGVIHFAAESHVDHSIERPESFVQTNVLGTCTLLETAKKKWMTAPFCVKEGYQGRRFHHISTDEVYGTLGETGCFSETTPYAPNSPYSASKAGADMLVRSYYRTFGLNVVTTNCSNNYGPKQHHEKLIPTIIRKVIAGESIPIYGNGQNVRDWLYVLDHCEAIDKVFHRGRAGESYNIGGNHELRNIDIAETICEIIDEMGAANRQQGTSKDLITYIEDRPGHDFRYAVDTTKIESELGWFPSTSFMDGIRSTVSWYLQQE